MPYAYNDGVRIYYEVTGTAGPPLVLQHGLTSSIEDWKRDGYVERIENDFQLILIDGRGHGKSDKPHTADDYRVSKRAFDVVAVLDDLDINRAHFWGVSMGAAIGYGLMWKAPERIDALVLGGGQPYEATPGSPIPKLLENGPEAMLVMIETARAAVGNTIPESRRAEILAMDTKAITAAVQFPWESAPVVEALKAFDRQFLLYVGEMDWGYDLIAKVPEDNPAVEFVTLSGLDHPGSWADVDAVVPVVLEFLGRQP